MKTKKYFTFDIKNIAFYMNTCFVLLNNNINNSHKLINSEQQKKTKSGKDNAAF